MGMMTFKVRLSKSTAYVHTSYMDYTCSIHFVVHRHAVSQGTRIATPHRKREETNAEREEAQRTISSHKV